MNNFEFSESAGSQHKQTDSQLSLMDMVNWRSSDTQDSSTLGVGSFKHPADDVRPVHGGGMLPHLVIKQGSISDYDGDPNHESKTQKAVAAEAVNDLGKEMWHNWTPNGDPGGGADAMEGCAASVSQILNDCGAASLHRPEDDNCDYMQADLLAQHWTLTDTPQPGDVWIGRGGESEAHTGILGENFVLMNNHSGNGKFSSDSAQYANAWTNSIYLQPPDQTQNS